MPPGIRSIRPAVDCELLLVEYFQAQMGDNYRLCADLPDPITQVTIRVTQVSGANRNIATDHPIIDLDVFSSPGGGIQEAKTTAIRLQQLCMLMRNLVTPQGTVQSVTTITDPRWLPDINPDLTRYAATYEFHTHGAPVQ